MLCDRCKIKEAKIYYTEITGGKKIEQHLCEDCAAELTSFQKEIPLESILSGLLGMSSGSSRSNRLCHVCGMSYQEFQKVGKFGCENCYKTFGRLHQGNLKRIQGATAHTGKIAASWQREQEKTEAEAAQETKQEQSKQSSAKSLPEQEEQIMLSKREEALKQAIASEEYEEAAKLRDEIRAIRASIEKGGCQECQKTD